MLGELGKALLKAAIIAGVNHWLGSSSDTDADHADADYADADYESQ